MAQFDLIKYLKTKFPETWEITNDVNINWNTTNNLMIVRQIDGGVDYKDGTRVQPIQLLVYAKNLNEVKTKLDLFVSENNQAYIRRDSTDIIQTYFPPVVIPQINADGDGYYYQVLCTGVLQISNNIDDIKKVFIDNVAYETTTRQLTYTTIPDTQNANINLDYCSSIIRISQNQFVVSLISKSQAINNKLRQLRSHDISVDTSFIIKLVYTNDAEETYTMKCLNHSIISNNGSIPTVQITFGE